MSTDLCLPALDRLADYVRRCTVVAPAERSAPLTAVTAPDMTSFPGQVLWVVMPYPFALSVAQNDFYLRETVKHMVQEAALEAGQHPSSFPKALERVREKLCLHLSSKHPTSDDEVFCGEGLAKRFDRIIQHSGLTVLAA